MEITNDYDNGGEFSPPFFSLKHLSKSMKEQAQQQTTAFDPLDMNNYNIEKLPKMQKSTFEKWMARWGGPLAIIAFILIYWVVDIPFIDNLTEQDFIPTEVVVEQADGSLVTMQPAPDKSVKKAVYIV